MRININDITAKKGASKITALTCYDFISAQILDGEIDILLVGDSLGMVIYGLDSTLPVTLEMMENHAKAVVKGSSKSLVVIDMPFGSYQQSPSQAFKKAAHLISQTGVQAVKLEGGSEMAPTVEFLTKRGIPVIGHIGLEPQSFNAYGGYKIQGKDNKKAKEILQSAKLLEQAGAFAIVIEGVPKKLADEITATTKIPTIGIGASPNCDGQVLVLHDMLGLNDKPAKFVKTYASVSETIRKAVKTYASEVKSTKFPGKDNCY